jgi:flagellar motor protein MotB
LACYHPFSATANAPQTEWGGGTTGQVGIGLVVGEAAHVESRTACMTFANNSNTAFAALVARRDLKSTGRPLLPRQADAANGRSHRVANVAAREHKRRPVGVLKLPLHSAPLQGNAATALMKADRLNGNTSRRELSVMHIQRVWRGCMGREELRELGRKREAWMENERQKLEQAKREVAARAAEAEQAAAQRKAAQRAAERAAGRAAAEKAAQMVAERAAAERAAAERAAAERRRQAAATCLCAARHGATPLAGRCVGCGAQARPRLCGRRVEAAVVAASGATCQKGDRSGLWQRAAARRAAAELAAARRAARQRAARQQAAQQQAAALRLGGAVRRWLLCRAEAQRAQLVAREEEVLARAAASAEVAALAAAEARAVARARREATLREAEAEAMAMAMAVAVERAKEEAKRAAARAVAAAAAEAAAAVAAEVAEVAAAAAVAKAEVEAAAAAVAAAVAQARVAAEDAAWEAEAEALAAQRYAKEELRRVALVQAYALQAAVGTVTARWRRRARARREEAGATRIQAAVRGWSVREVGPGHGMWGGKQHFEFPKRLEALRLDFGVGAETLNATCRADLAFVIATLKRQRGLKIRCVGRCKHTEVPAVATKRATAVRRHLCQHGVLQNQLRAEGAPPPVVGGVMEQGGSSVSFKVVQGLLLPKPLRFGLGEAKLGPETVPLLAKVARSLEDNPSFDLLIEGHADASECDAARLCAARAAAVKRSLLSHGVRCHLHTAAMGTDCPLAPNLTAQGRTHNRRVELQLRCR